MLSIIPADTLLASAIKDATLTTSTVNPARITTAVQKMRPDWSVNKRRVKRLLRSMNNDAWKAAVTPASVPSDATIDTTATEPSGTAPSSAAETSTRGKSASKAAKAAKAAEKAAKAASKAAAAKAAAADAECVAGTGVCDTAPASPGSPATSTTAERGSPAVSSVSTVASGAQPVVASVASATTPSNAAVGAAPDSTAAVGTSSPTAPWEQADENIPAIEGGEEEEALSRSLRLEPDLELEVASVEDLKADLGLPATTPAVGEERVFARDFEESSQTGLVEGEAGEEETSTGDELSRNSASENVQDLGFEIIEKAEAAGAATTAGDAQSTPTGVVGATGKARKGWPWAWGRN